MTPPLQEFRTITVALTADPYPVVIGKGVLAEMGARIGTTGAPPGTKVLVVTNPVVWQHYGEKAMESLATAGFDAHLLVVDAGEERKTAATVATIHDAAFEARLERAP